MIRTLALVLRVTERLPSWLRPAFLGAAALCGIVAFRMLFAVPVLVRQPAKLRELGLGLLAATAAGAAGGLCYTVIGKPLLRVPLAGPYLAGVAMVAGYVLPLVVAMPFISPGEPLLANFVSPPSFAVAAVLCGLMVGVQLAKPA